MQISTVCERNGNKRHLARLHSRLQALYKHGGQRAASKLRTPKFVASGESSRAEQFNLRCKL